MARKMKDSGIEWIGEIPEGWEVSKLKYLGRYVNGYPFKPDDWGDKGKPIIRIQDLTGSNDSPNYYDGDIDAKYHIKNGDILVLNCTPFVRQYGILFRKWGVFVCQRDNESTTERRR